MAVLIAISFGMTACSDDEPRATTAAPQSATVRIVDGELRPRTVEVAAGGTVTWINDDVSDHRLLSLEPDVFISDRLEPGDSWSSKFDAPGEYRYYDRIRNTIKGTLIVR